MKVVVQRVINSSVLIDSEITKKINKGLMILVGFTYNDTKEDIDYIVRKVLNLRIFEENDKMTLSVSDIDGEILVIPQFTLYANPYKGNRPSFEKALNPKEANILFETFKEEILKSNLKIEYGKFGSDMKVSLINDGPVTIIIDSKER
ncbi:MAG: D-tyrosyl-tRNA(Tyr) deacylase [Bacilli bacterium]|nr:D-tyrosyl-tRNA(Tyr) deacylase [Bacilli bacterium]